METVHRIAEVRTQVAAWRRQGQSTVLVPTMGNLHEGHLDLVRTARSLGDRVVVSVFVNPMQFGPHEDFERYPRTLPQDQQQLAHQQADLLFAPSAAEMYPCGSAETSRVRVPGVSDTLEGSFRPGHFDGVATVVNMLFNIVQPDSAVFGQKDYQQLLVIRAMVRQLQMPVEVFAQATRREADGLAMSSRNQYLTAEQRRAAPRLYAALEALAADLRAGRRDYAAMTQAASQQLAEAGFVPQYLEIRNPDLSEPSADTAEWVLLAAAHLGTTRLIDNLLVRL